MTERGPAAGAVGPLGILASAGPLPIEVAEAAVRAGRDVHVVAIDGFAGPEVARFPHERVSLGQLGRMLASFARAGVRDIVIAGAMQRPDLLRLRIDWGFVRHLPTVLSLTRGGDDSVLRRVVRFFEGQGLRVVGVSEVAPCLLAPDGQLGHLGPGPEHVRAIAHATRLVAALGPFDVGQAVVASADGVVAIEGVRGTDALLRDLGPGGAGAGLGAGAVLVKLAKPGQEMRIDLPAIGPETVRGAREAGLAGIAVGRGAAIVLERERLVADADAGGLFVAGVEGIARPLPAPGAAPEGAEVPEPAPLAVIGRRAPTPADRRDIAIGRRLIGVLGDHRAGHAALVSREHVLGLPGALPLVPFLLAQGRPASWGRRRLKGRLGVLLIDGGRAGSGATTGDGNGSDTGSTSPIDDAELFRAAMATGLAGIVVLGTPPAHEERARIEAWANEAGVFVMAEAGMAEGAEGSP